jgi:hypothetical protein
MWIKQPKFKAEFHRATTKDLLTPAKSFLYAAWILKGLRDQPKTRRTLPYWSYYNSVRFENRFKYFLAVNHYISALRKNEDFFSERAVATAQTTFSKPRHKSGAYRSPIKRRPNSSDDDGRVAALLAPSAETNPAAQKWIPDALLKLERDQTSRGLEAESVRPPTTDMIDLISKARIQD